MERTSRWRRIAAIAAIGTGLVLAGSACSSSDSTTEGSSGADGAHRPQGAVAFDATSPFLGRTVSSLQVGGSEWAIASSSRTAVAGPVEFTFTNAGTIPHEMLVVRTDLPLGGITVDPETERFDEDDPTIEVIDEIAEIEVGVTESATFELEPGTYQLVCNLPSHYANGMRTTLIVR